MYLVAQALAGNDGDFIADTLVGLEVEGELGVVPLDDDLGGLLNGLCPDATHCAGLYGWTVDFVVEVVVLKFSRRGYFEAGSCGWAGLGRYLFRCTLNSPEPQPVLRLHATRSSL